MTDKPNFIEIRYIDGKCWFESGAVIKLFENIIKENPYIPKEYKEELVTMEMTDKFKLPEITPIKVKMLSKEGEIEIKNFEDIKQGEEYIAMGSINTNLFEEQFPSLKGYVGELYLYENKEGIIRKFVITDLIKANCLDKKKVLDILNNEISDTLDVDGVDGKIFKKRLLKELRLE